MPVLMPSPVFRWFTPDTGVPAVGYIATFFAAGTDIAKTIYTSPDLSDPYPSPANEAVLDSQGKALIYLGPGSYKLRVLDPDRVQVYCQDDINGDGSFGTGFLDTVIATDDPMTNGLAQYDTANRFVWCAGYYAVGDGGHGFFWNAVSEEADNGGYVIASTQAPTRKWFRVPDESGDVRAASFGYIGSKAGNLSNQMTSACSYAQGYGKRLIIGPGSTAVLGVDENDFYIYAPFVYLEAGSMLTGTGDFDNFIFPGHVSGTPEQHITNAGYTLQTPQEDDHPQWVGAFPSGSDCTAAFAKWLASGASAYTLPPGVWLYADTTTFPFPSVPLTLLGSVDATATGSDIPTGYYGTDTSRFRLNRILFTGGATMTGAESHIDVIGDVDITGEFGVVGGISATESISTDSHVNADGDVSAGVGGTGRLTSRAGSGTARYQASGQIGTTIGSSATSGTSVTPLLSRTLAANSIVSDGDRLRIIVGGTFTGGAPQPKRISIAFNTGSIPIYEMFDVLTMEAGSWNASIDLWKNGSGFSALGNAAFSDPSNSVSAIVPDTRTGAINFAIDQSISVYATASVSGSITQTVMSFEYLPQHS